MRMNLSVAFAALALTAAPAAAQTVLYDDNPDVAFTYGTGNNYTPANAVTLTTNPSSDRSNPLPTGELAVRAHVPGQPAASTGGTGIYTFNLGSAVSFDFSVFGSALTDSNLVLTNLAGGSASFNPASYLGILAFAQPSGAIQGSQQLGFGFLNGSTALNTTLFGDLNFDNTVNSTYRIDLTGGGQTITAFAQLGTGAAVAAVPEPATWAMMLIGFGGIGYSMRRRRKTTAIVQFA